jgi:hypothetical protein
MATRGQISLQQNFCIKKSSSTTKSMHIRINNPWWTDQHRSLSYINEPFNDPESLAKWQDLGYTQTRFTGDMYDMRNSEPDWVLPFRAHFPWRHFSWSVYRMGPGTTLPNHRDTYSRFREIYNIEDPDTIFRAVVFLENWQSGHYFEINEDPYVEWAAGETVIWQNNTQHLAANMGMTDRYTLQITGVPDENIFVQ